LSCRSSQCRSASKDHVQARRPGISLAERVAGVIVFVVDLDIRHAGELLHGFGKRLNEAVGCTAGPAVARQIYVEQAVRKLDPPITNEAVPCGCQAATLFLRVRTFEVFVQGGCDGVTRAADLARDRLIKRRRAIIEPLRDREIDIDRNWRRR
jgi:hypothetical protein